MISKEPIDFKYSGICTHLKALKTRDNICPNFAPLNLVGTILGVRSHRSRAGTLVVALACLFCSKRKALDVALQRLGGLHGDWVR